MIDEYAHMKPPTRKALYEWVKAFFGFTLHDVVRCTKPEHLTMEEADDIGLPHNCQLDYCEGVFFEKHEASLFVGARSSGKSECIAICILLDALLKPGIQIVCSAFSDGQSQEVASKALIFLSHYVEVSGYGDMKNLCDVLKHTIDFKNGSFIEFRTASGKAGIKSRHPDRLYVDEVDLFPPTMMSSLENSLTAREFRTQTNLVSTSYTMSLDSVVLSKTQSFKEYNLSKPDHLKPMVVYKICLLDVMETCDSRYKCHNEETKTNCALWDFCEGRAKDIKGGYYQIGEAIKKTANRSKASFDAEMLLQTPMAEDAYFPTFCSKHICDPGRVFNPTLETMLGFDFGGFRCPNACVVVQTDLVGNFYVIDEFEMMGNFENLIDKVKRAYPGVEKYARSFMDAAGNKKDAMEGAKSYKDLLVAAGFAPRYTTLVKRKDSFDLIAGVINPADGKQKFWINKGCKSLIRQLRQAQQKNDKPVDNGGDDVLDCLRYVLYFAIKYKARQLRKWAY